MGKVDINKSQKKQRLLDTAFELYTTLGIAKTSISNIVDRAGVAKGTFYLYFRDKYDLEENLIVHKSEEILSKAISEIDIDSIEDFSEFMILLTNNIITQFEANPKLLRFINKNLSWGILRRSLNLSETDYMKEFYEFTARFSVRYREPKLLLYTIIEFVSSTCYNLILEKDPTDMDSYRPYMNSALRAIIETFRES